MERVLVTGGRMAGRSFRERERLALIHRSKLRAKELFGKRLRNEITREEVIAELNAMAENARELVRAELNRLNNEYRVRKL